MPEHRQRPAGRSVNRLISKRLRAPDLSGFHPVQDAAGARSDALLGLKMGSRLPAFPSERLAEPAERVPLIALGGRMVAVDREPRVLPATYCLMCCQRHTA